MKKLMAVFLLFFPASVTVTNAVIAVSWKDTNDIKYLITKETLTRNYLWSLTSLRGYDDGLMPSIKTNVLLALGQNAPWIDINTLDIQVYYGNINDNNFYQATPIDFSDFKNDGLILYFTVGIFTKVGEKYQGHQFINFDFRPTWTFPAEDKVSLNNNGTPINSIDSLVKAWNNLLQNQIIINNFNQQFQTMGVDISLGMGLQPGQMLISDDTKNYLKLSGEEINEDNDHITITNNLFSYLPDKLRAALFKLPANSFLLPVGQEINVKSKDIKDNGYDYSYLDYEVTLDLTLEDLLVPMRNYLVTIINNIYHKEIDPNSFSVQFKKNSYADSTLLNLSTPIRDLSTFTSPEGDKKHWVWIEMFNATDTLLNISSTPGFHLAFKI
ncbi:hypothetical protein [Spiroplasma sp. DGKH1]|uniref:hypothetical protein n=1 Tax=Spiroplasma sp. DGKH1 TaxID=3050074 RepID=UPI0034C64849